MGDFETLLRRGYQPAAGTTVEEARRHLSGEATAHQLSGVMKSGANLVIDGTPAAVGSTVTTDAQQLVRCARAGLVDVIGDALANTSRPSAPMTTPSCTPASPWGQHG